jgi:hypothetical protein
MEPREGDVFVLALEAFGPGSYEVILVINAPTDMHKNPAFNCVFRSYKGKTDNVVFSTDVLKFFYDAAEEKREHNWARLMRT